MTPEITLWMRASQFTENAKRAIKGYGIRNSANLEHLTEDGIQTILSGCLPADHEVIRVAIKKFKDEKEAAREGQHEVRWPSCMMKFLSKWHSTSEAMCVYRGRGIKGFASEGNKSDGVLSPCSTITLIASVGVLCGTAVRVLWEHIDRWDAHIQLLHMPLLHPYTKVVD